MRWFWRPFVLLQLVALAVVVAYFRVPAVAAACDRVSRVKVAGGLAFSAGAAAVAGAFLPEAAKAVVGHAGRWDRQRWRDLAFVTLGFAVNGVTTDLQYRGMAAVFGHGTGWATVLKKVLADQFVTTPLYGTTYWSVVYAIRADRYRVWRTVPTLTPRWYARTVVPLLVTGWAFWIPMCLLVYSLPGPLQFLLFVFAIAAWSLLMVAVASGSTEGEVSR